jgi:hypothetical protein
VPDDGFGVVATPPRQQARDHFVFRSIKLQHRVDIAVAVSQQLLQRLRLRDSAGKAVEDKPAPADIIGKPLRHHRVGDFIRDQGPRIQVVLDLPTEFGIAVDVGPEQIAGGNMHYAKLVAEHCGLGTLTRSGWADDDDSH